MSTMGVETDRIWSVRRARREDAGLGARAVTARMNA